PNVPAEFQTLSVHRNFFLSFAAPFDTIGENNLTPVFDEKGQIVYAIAAFTDITQRKRSEAERVQFTQELGC
ncbi:MAG: hypothetical protein AB4290_07670, partial [Spirulina sp.]